MGVFQVCAPGLVREFPALRTVDATPNNLPVQLTSFIGRESEIAMVGELLASNRLVTLTGAAGCGKTRLALQAGAELLGQYSDGVWLVELAALTDPALVVGAIASSLGIRPADAGIRSFGDAGGSVDATSLEELVLDYVSTKALVLILDNCEHLLGACSSFVDRALHVGEGLRIMATSREPLGVAGEATRRVPSLTMPDPARLPSSELLGDYEAVRLFVDRATLRAAGFAPTDEDMTAIVQICDRLDGIPLAIELAAARVKVLAPADIAKRLDDQFLLLTGGTRTALERHQTLRAAVDWSYNLLSELEQVLLARLSVFAGSLSLEAAEAVCGDDTLPAAEVLDLVEHLVDRSLVDAEPTRSGVRYRLLESIRQYGRERLASSGEADTLRDRHAGFFADLAARTQRLLWSRDPGPARQAVEADLDNVRAAVAWSLARHDTTQALQIVTSLDMFWMSAGPRYGHEALVLLDQCLSDTGDAPAILRARALSITVVVARNAGELHRSFIAGQEAVALYRELGDTRGLALVLGQLGFTARDLGRNAEGEAYADEAIEVSRESGFTPGLGSGLQAKAVIAYERGDLEGSRSASAEILASRDRFLPAIVASGLNLRGVVAIAGGDYAAAIPWFQEAAQVQERNTGSSAMGDAAHGLAVAALALEDAPAARGIWERALEYVNEERSGPVPEAICLAGLGDVALHEGNVDQAETNYRRALELLEQVGRRHNVPVHLARVARVALARGDPERAAQLLGASAAMREQLEVTSIVSEWPPPDDTITAAQAALDAAAFSAAWANGSAMTPDQAVTYALDPPGRR
jgi:predicted ATPase